MPRDLIREFDHCMPAAGRNGAKLGQLLNELVNTTNANTAAIQGIAAKLDADAGVTDVNYSATWAAGLAAIKTLKARGDAL